MYAAAGGASLASRQARQRQRQNKKTEKLAQLKSQSGKPAAGATPATNKPQSKQFHHLPANYQSSTIKLSRVERNALRPPAPAERRHSTSNHLKEPARAKIRESPSILLPIQPNHLHQTPKNQPLTPTTLVETHNHIPLSPSLCQLPLIHDPERRCSLVRQYEEAEKAEKEPNSTDPDFANHVHCFEFRDKGPDGNPLMYTEMDTAIFGSMDYPFSEIHDTSYGGSSDDEDFFSVYYQSAAANALLYVGLGTTVIGLVIWFVGTGEKGFKTLELRLIGPTLIALGLFCCLVRVLLCICPSTCFRRRKKTRLKNTCPHRFNKDRREAPPTGEDFVLVDHSTSLLGKNKKRVSIAPNSMPVPCSSSSQHKHPGAVGVTGGGGVFDREQVLAATTVFLAHEKERNTVPKPIPTIEIPDFADFASEARVPNDDSFIELQNLELSSIEVSSVSSDSDSITIIEAEITKAPSKLIRSRQPKLSSVNETSLTLGGNTSHSGIVLSPSKLGQ